MSLLVGTLAVTWAWDILREVLRVVENRLPWSLPSWLLPLLALGVGLIFCWPNWHLAAACVGAAGIIRALLRPVLNQAPPVTAVRGIGNRVPPLP